MKRFLTYCLVAVILFMGMTTSAVFRNQTAIAEHNPLAQKQTTPLAKQSCFSVADVSASLGIGNQQIRLTNLFQQASFRVLPSLTNAFRISYLSQLANLQFFNYQLIFLRKSAFSKYEGYYLYHLRKLLI